MWPGTFEQTFVPPSHKRSMWNLTLIDPEVFEEKMFKECGRRRTTDDDGRRRPTYTISSPMSLRLRWANKRCIFFFFWHLWTHWVVCKVKSLSSVTYFSRDPLRSYFEVKRQAMIRNWYNQIPHPALKTKREITKYINRRQFTKGTSGKPNEQLFPK